METTMRLIRGQVWRWIDPIYGEKRGKRIDVEVGEMTLRYNRYVIIMQDTESIDQHSVLVIPCSSHKRYETDIRIDLTHIFSVTSTYAQPRKVFPVHPKMLDKYICTLSDDVMNELEVSMMTLTSPIMADIIRRLEDNEISSKVDEVYNKEYNKAKISVVDNKATIKSFIDENIIPSTSDIEIPISDIRDLFDRYCGDHAIDSNDIDMPMFVDSLCRELNIDDFFHTDKYKYHHIKIKGIVLKGYPIDNDISDTDVKPLWDNFRKKEFLSYLERNGIDKTAEEFGIKTSTVSRYKSRFTKELSETGSDISISVEENKLNDEIINDEDMMKIISNMSNVVTNDIRARGMYRQYKRNFKGHHPMKEATYYKAIGCSIYYGLFGLFGIKEKSSNVISMPSIRSDHKYISTVRALQTIYDISISSNIQNGLDLMRLINTKGKEKIGISSDVMPIIRSQLNERINIKPQAVNNLIDKIRETYCK